MRTYKTETVKVDASYGIPSKTKTFREDDIIILYAVWNLSTKLSSQYDLPRFMGETGSGKSQVRLLGSNLPHN